MNVLLSAVGRRAYLVDYFRKAVAPYGGRIYATNTTPDATGFLVADEAAVVPPAASPEFVDALLGLCQKWHIKLLFSLHDWEAPVIARNRQRFLEVGTIPVMGGAEMMAACLDKFRTIQVAKTLGVAVPCTYLGLDEVHAALASGAEAFPLIVKPRWGQGSVGLFKVEDTDELEWAYRLSERGALKFAKVCPEIDASQSQVLIQSCIDGDEYGCDIINNLNGKFQRAFVKHKFAMRSGETDAAESVDMPQIIYLAEKIAQWSLHLGCMDSDFMVDRKTGTPYLIELNPRFGGGYPFTHAAGANVPEACVRWAMGDADVEERWAVGYQVGVKTFKEIALLSVSRMPDADNR